MDKFEFTPKKGLKMLLHIPTQFLNLRHESS